MRNLLKIISLYYKFLWLDLTLFFTKDIAAMIEIDRRMGLIIDDIDNIIKQIHNAKKKR